VRFIALAAQLRIGGGLLRRCWREIRHLGQGRGDSRKSSHKCDTLTHQNHPAPQYHLRDTHRSRDIHALAKSLDDVMDMIDASPSCSLCTRIGPVRYGARNLRAWCR